jgi:hypothetical protein
VALVLQPEMATARPATTPDELSKSIATDTPSIPRPAYTVRDLDAVAESLAGRFVVQVTVDESRGFRRTFVYRSCAAAEKCVERARERGQTAHVSLVRMLPVGVVAGVVR